MVKKKLKVSVNEPVILRSQPDTRDKYDTSEVIEFIVEKRNDDLTFEKITELLKERGYESIGTNKVSELYHKAIARSTLVHHTANEQFVDFSEQLKEMFGKAIKVLGRLVDAMDKVADEFEASDLDTMAKYMKLIKMTPEIKMGVSEVRSMVKDWQEKQDKIITEQKSLVWSESQMTEYINNYIPTLLSDYEKKGYDLKKVIKEFKNS
jgi:hypothetical protein